MPSFTHPRATFRLIAAAQRLNRKRNTKLKALSPKINGKNVIPPNKWKIVSGDQVRIIYGPEAGKEGKVLEVIRRKNSLVVDGMNARMRYLKPRQGLKGKMNAQVKKVLLDDGTRARVVKKSGAIIPYPAIKERKPDILQGPYDTDPVDALEQTFNGFDLDGNELPA